jgi:hypothetical protein
MITQLLVHKKPILIGILALFFAWAITIHITIGVFFGQYDGVLLI